MLPHQTKISPRPQHLGRFQLATATVMISATLCLACTPGATNPDSTNPDAALPPSPTGSLELQSTSLQPPSGDGALAPNWSATGDSIRLTWIEPTQIDGQSGHRLRLARLDDDTWTAARDLALGTGFFANWTDLPAMVETPGGQLYAHWLDKLGDDTYAYGIRLVAAESDAGPWVSRGLLHDDQSATEHGFVSYTSTAEAAQAFWLDGRAMKQPEGAMQLRSGQLSSGQLGSGQPASSQPATTSQLLDDRVCECCATDAATSADGPLVVYRDRAADEVRDIAIIRTSPEGWTQPKLIHADGWKIFGCPVNGPAIAADGQQVAVAWFTAAQDQARVQVALSNDGGASFAPPLLVDPAEPLGRVDIALDPRGGFLLSWIARHGEQAQIRIRQVLPTGQLGDEKVVVDTTANRAAGVPRLLRNGDQILITWTETSQPQQIRVARLDLPATDSAAHR